MSEIDVRKGMPSTKLSREEFDRRFRSRFSDPAFEPLEAEITAMTAAAWDGYTNSRKSPRTRKAGAGFADPDYDLAVDWINARDAIVAAQKRHDDPDEIRRVLLINGSSRSDQTCPGEMSKTYRMAMIAEPILQGRIRGRFPGSFPIDIGDGATNSSLQILRLDCDAAVSLAM